MVSRRKFATAIILLFLCFRGGPRVSIAYAQSDQDRHTKKLLNLAADLKGPQRQMCLDAARYADTFAVVYPFSCHNAPPLDPDSLLDWVEKAAQSSDYERSCPVTSDEEQLVVKLCDAHAPTADIQQLVDDRFSNEIDTDSTSYQYYLQHVCKYVPNKTRLNALKEWLATYSAADRKIRFALVKTIVVQACELPDSDNSVAGTVAEKLAKNPLFNELQSGGLSFTFNLQNDGSITDLKIDPDGSTIQRLHLKQSANKGNHRDERQTIAAMIKKSAPFKLIRFSVRETPVTASFFWNSLPTNSIVSDDKPSLINWIGMTFNNVGQVPHDVLLQIAKTVAHAWNPSGKYTKFDDISADCYVYADESVARGVRASDAEVSRIFSEPFPVLHPAVKTANPVPVGSQPSTNTGLPIPKGAKIPRERMDIHASFGRSS